MSNLRNKININTAGTEIFTTSLPGNVYVQGSTTLPVNVVSSTTISVLPKNSTGGNLFTQAIPGITDFHNPNVDAFGRLRISQAQTVFDNTMQYHTQTAFYWNESVTGVGASITHLPNESSAKLEVGTVSGEKVVRQSKRYIRYQPGKSQYISLSALMGAIKSNVRQRIGYFDEQNGLFFEQDGTNFKVVRRTYVTGSAVDTTVNQADWNLDKLDGTGPSGKTVDNSKTQIFIIDFQWLGVGRVRFGIDLNGEKIYCHEMYNANSLTEVYMTTANLPIRFEIENTGLAASATSMKQICASVASESGYTDERGFSHSAGTGITSLSVAGRAPVVTIRPRPTYNGITNRADILPESFDLLVTGQSVFYELVFNGTPNTTTWNSPSTNCLFQFQTDSTALTGGEVLDAGFIAAGGTIRASISETLKNKLSLSNSLDGTTPETFSIVATAVSATATVYSQITAKEIY